MFREQEMIASAVIFVVYEVGDSTVMINHLIKTFVNFSNKTVLNINNQVVRWAGIFTSTECIIFSS